MDKIEIALVANRIHEALISLMLPQIEWTGLDDIIELMQQSRCRVDLEVAYGHVHNASLDVVYYPVSAFFSTKNDGTLIVKETEGWPAVLVYDAASGKTEVQTVDCDEIDFRDPPLAVFHRICISDEPVSNCRVIN